MFAAVVAAAAIFSHFAFIAIAYMYERARESLT